MDMRGSSECMPRCMPKHAPTHFPSRETRRDREAQDKLIMRGGDVVPDDTVDVPDDAVDML